jgi:hypothetical protein
MKLSVVSESSSSVYIMGSGDACEESEEDRLIIEMNDKAGQQGDTLPSLDVCDSEEDDMGEWNDAGDVDVRLPKVLKAFQSLKKVFDGKFKQTWA